MSSPYSSRAKASLAVMVGGVFAVRGDEQRAGREYPFQRGLVVDQHVAGGRAHEHLDAACLGDVHGLDGFEVVVGRAEVERIVGERVACGPRVLVAQGVHGDGLRGAVGHLHVARDAADDSGARLRCDGALVFEARLPEMNLIVDHAGQQPGTGKVDFVGFATQSATEVATDALDAAVGDRHIAFEGRAFVDDGGVFEDAGGHVRFGQGAGRRLPRCHLPTVPTPRLAG